MKAFVCCLTVLLAAALVRGSGWSYDEEGADGPDHWKDSNPSCGGQNDQSPINIATAAATWSSTLNKIDFIQYNTVPRAHFTLTNNGHTVQVSTNVNTFRIKGGGLHGEYVLEQFHFHWGHDENSGSEHTLDGHEYPLEIHFVHRQEKYASVNDALSDPDGIAVLGVFVKLDNSHSPSLDYLVNSLQLVKYKGDTISIDAFALDGFFPHSKEYFRYHGSLTTPPCTPSVIWTVFQQPIGMLKDQLEAFHHLYESDTEEIDHNNRPMQAVGDRTVYMGGNH